ncbi:class III lanthipeptide [Bacillus thuringiensis]|nr:MULTISPECIES: class III lanthipeptide [Bacillus cereus group]MCT6901879.1 class III lanthipeptide [Lactobacillus sp.]MCU5455874.1 class III lanthipeptide [Bacillus cereus]MCU5512833.1 class III lanthipeptide [Bacillus cereus]MCU5550264.1 class III lanthipeptide [Bacillus cereus]MCU5621701.1 class III lanthipeptide [Bacillus cereus]
MRKVLSLQKIDNRSSKKGGILNSAVSLGCAPSSNTSWFFC